MSSRLNDGRQHGLRLGRCYTPDKDIPDLTKPLERRIMRPLEKGNVTLDTIGVNGLQGSGKTQYCMYWLYRIQQAYPGRVQSIYADNLEIAYSEIRKAEEDVDVVAIVIDDAMAQQSSYSTMRQEDRARQWFEIRHIFEDAQGKDTGKIFALLNWQRMQSLNVNFRNAQLFTFLSPMADKSDINRVMEKTGDIGYTALQAEWDRRRSIDPSMRRSRAVIRMTDKTSSEGVGWHEYHYIPTHDPSWQPPTLLKTVDYFRDIPKPTKAELLAQLEQDDRYTVRVRWYRDFMDGKPQASIAADYGRAQSTVSEGIARVRELIADGA